LSSAGRAFRLQVDSCPSLRIFEKFIIGSILKTLIHECHGGLSLIISTTFEMCLVSISFCHDAALMFRETVHLLCKYRFLMRQAE